MDWTLATLTTAASINYPEAELADIANKILAAYKELREELESAQSRAASTLERLTESHKAHRLEVESLREENGWLQDRVLLLQANLLTPGAADELLTENAALRAENSHLEDDRRAMDAEIQQQRSRNGWLASRIEELEKGLLWIGDHPQWQDSYCIEPVDVRPGKVQDCDCCGACFSRIARETLRP